MTIDEMKARLEELSTRITELEQTEQQACAELGRKLLPGLEENSEHADLVSQIRETDEKLDDLRKELGPAREEYNSSIAKLTCFACKTVNPEGAAFCEECGAKLGEKPKEYCETCGTVNRPGQKFCGECGAKLANE